ncbi:hypothetical protein KR044_001546, partial [Drosophila immigrans]
PALNISNRRKVAPIEQPTTPSIKPRGKKNKKTDEPKFEKGLFPLMLSGILLKPEPPKNVKLAEYNHKYLGVLCLKNMKTGVRIYHMFPTCDRYIGRDYEQTRLLYENKPNIKNWNNVTTQTICPETLRRSAVAHFTNCKWNKDKNIMEVQTGELDEWALSNKLQELHVKQVKKLFNYIKFLKLSKE